tara:strand:- start:69 stop:1253 length:1185 start_codon:yes stop_codon:yes gene_type:complete
MVRGILDDVTVVELAQDVAGPYGSKLLADQGANVIKVEPISGDTSRQWGPYPDDCPHLERSLSYAYYNTNKKSVTLNIDSDKGKSLLRRLVVEADILIEDIAPSRKSVYGLEDLSVVKPDLIHVSVTPFGVTGPYRDYAGAEIIYQAMGGFMHLSGEPDRGPLQIALNQGQVMAGRNVALSTMAAIYMQAGQFVDVSIMESVAVQPPFHILTYTHTGIISGRGLGAGGIDIFGGDYLETKDGHICMTTEGRRSWEDLALLLEIPELSLDQFADPQDREKHRKALEELVLPELKEKDTKELFHKAMREGFVFGMVQSPQDLLQCEQLEERGAWSEIEHSELGKLKYPNPGFNMSAIAAAPDRPAPLLGEHNSSIYTSMLQISPDELKELKSEGVV